MHNQEDINYLSEILVEIVAYMTNQTNMIKYVSRNIEHGRNSYGFRFPKEGDRREYYVISAADANQGSTIKFSKGFGHFKIKIFKSFTDVTASDLLVAIQEQEAEDLILS